MAAFPGTRDSPPIVDRALVEEITRRLLATAPPNWTHLHAEFQPGAQAFVGQVQVSTADGSPSTLTAEPEVLAVVAEHQHRSAAAGRPWRTLVIDCGADGRLWAQTDPVTAVRGPRRWPQWLLAAITIGCSIAAALVFALGWRWAPPPRAAMIPVPLLSPREKQAKAAIDLWFDAESRSDADAMRALLCAQPGQNVIDEIDSLVAFGNLRGITYVDAITEFRDEGDRVSAVFAVRIHPTSEQSLQDAQAAQDKGGFLRDQYTFAVEGGVLKVCDSDTGPS